MASPAVNRVVAEAALARRLADDVNKLASQNDVSKLVSDVENFDGDSDGAPGSSPIALDTDGVPYVTIGA